MPEIIPAIMGVLGTAGTAIGSAAGAIGTGGLLDIAAMVPAAIQGVGALTSGSPSPVAAPATAAATPAGSMTPGQRALTLGSQNAQALTGGSLSPDADMLYASILAGQPLPNWGTPGAASTPGGTGVNTPSIGAGASSFDVSSLLGRGATPSQAQVAGGS